MKYIFYDWTIGGLPEVLISTENPVKADDMVYYLSKYYDIRISEVSEYVTQIDVKLHSRKPIDVLYANVTGVESKEMGQKI